MNETYDCTGKKHSRYEETFWDVIFKQNGVASILINENLRTEKSFTVKNNVINFPYASYEISKITTDSLVLTDKGERCVNYIFLSESANDKRKSQIIKEKGYKHFMYKGDTVYFTTKNNSPEIKRYRSYHEYFTRAFPNHGETEGCVIKFQFIVNKNGLILNPKGSISCLEDDSKAVNTIINGMQGKWEPMIIDGQPVNSLVREKLTHGPTVIIDEKDFGGFR